MTAVRIPTYLVVICLFHEVCSILYLPLIILGVHIEKILSESTVTTHDYRLVSYHIFATFFGLLSFIKQICV